MVIIGLDDASTVEAAGLLPRVRGVPDPALGGEGRFCVVAQDEEGIAGVATGIGFRLTPDDACYTYLPPEHVVVPIGGWAVRPGAPFEVLEGLWDAARSQARELGVDRVQWQARDDDWREVAAVRVLGLRPDTAFALRPTLLPAAPRVAMPIRPATADDLDALVALALEEVDYHAAHTGSGMASDQSPDTVRRLCEGWLDHADDERVERAFVATQAGRIVGVTTVHCLTTPASVGNRLLPARYGYVGLASVTGRSRGRGVGRALAASAIDWCRRLADPPEAVGLHFVTDNITSAPFWTGLGFTPVITTFTNAAPQRGAGASGCSPAARRRTSVNAWNPTG